MHALVEHRVPFVLAGSIRDDGPLPEVLSDTLAAQDAMRQHTAQATFAVFVATALHAIAVGNMLPAFVDAPTPDGIRPLTTISVWSTIGSAPVCTPVTTAPRIPSPRSS